MLPSCVRSWSLVAKKQHVPGLGASWDRVARPEANFVGDVVKEGPIERARALEEQGRLDEAEAIYRKVLERVPRAPRALEGLGVLLFQRGRAQEAAACFARGVELWPVAPLFRANLGEALRILDQLDLADEHLKQAVALDPACAQAWNSLGLLASGRRRHAEAESACREAIRLLPRFPAAYINLANALMSQNRRAEAIEKLRTALSIEPDHVTALTNLSYALTQLGDVDLLDEAEALARRAVALSPRLAPAVENLGHVLRLQGRPEEALRCYQRSSELDPLRPAPVQCIGQLLQERGRFDEAALLFEKARALDPDEPRFHADLGSLAVDRERYDEADEHFRRAVALGPQCAQVHLGRGLALLEAGRLEEAEACLREALAIDPTLAASWVALARIDAQRGDIDRSCQEARSALAIEPRLASAYRQLALNMKGCLPDADMSVIEGLLEHKYLAPSVRAALSFALGAVLDARGLYARAAACFESANQVQAAARVVKRQTYDPDLHSRFVDALIARFSPEFLAQRRGWGDPDPRPVFVVGLPRSGTTLVEQVLASHSQVHGADELRDVHRIFHSLPDVVGQPGALASAAIDALNPVRARAMARRYLERLDSLAPPTAARVIDKMPDNILYLGLIAVLWPGARVIICSRDLRDIAVSCRQTDFNEIRWSNDWEHLARRFADHRRMVAHWRETKPLPWMDVRYEDMVGDFEDNLAG
jgi:tetratricopeptide (TPR) repeat protein